MHDRLRELVTRHCETLRRNVAEVALCIRPLDGAAIDPQAVEKSVSITHQVKGSGGSLGFPEVSAAAAELERHLRLLDAAGGHRTPELTAGLEDSLATLEKLTRGLVPQDSTLFNANIDRLGAGKTGTSA